VPVDVNVNVIDKSGRPVPDQAAGDFTLTVDGKPRRAVSAQFISRETLPRRTRRLDSRVTPKGRPIPMCGPRS
jgi:hypothetical protein